MQSVIIRSLLEFPDSIVDFEEAMPLKYFDASYRKLLEKIKTLDKVSYSAFRAALSDVELKSQEFAAISSAIPEADFLEYERPLKKEFALKEQEHVAQLLLKAAKEKRIIDLENLGDFVSETKANKFLSFEDWERLYDVRGEPERIPTGIDFLDQALDGGFTLGSLVLMGGDSEMGKTSLCLQFLEGLSQKSKVGFFCFEFTVWDYVKRKKDSKSFNKKNMIILNDEYDIKDIERNIKILTKRGVKAFLIDSQMRVGNSGKGENMEEKQTQKFSTLAKLCHKLDIVILMIYQTSKGDRESPFGSKIASYEASVIMRLEKVEIQPNDIKNKNKPFHPERRIFVMQKNKITGRHFSEEVAFNPKTQTFKGLYFDTKKELEVDIEEVRETLNLDDEPF